jgi:TonB family protein
MFPVVDRRFSCWKCRILLLGVALLSTTSGAAADEQPEIESLASRVTQEIISSGRRKVAIDRFHPEKERNAPYVLGKWLSEQLAAAMAKDKKDLEIFDRAYLIPFLKRQNWPILDLEYPDVFRSTAHLAGADALVNGTFKDLGEVLELTVMVFDASSGKKISETKERVPRTQTMKELKDTLVYDPESGVYFPGAGGVSYPKCRRCPNPEFSREATEKRISDARVMLLVIITVQGRVSDIRLVQRAGYGLDENTVQVVQGWKLAPARLPDGTPVSVRVPVETTFRPLR